MKKTLLLLLACLFGALSGVKAYNFATPEVGKTYYLLNPEYNQFWYAIGPSETVYHISADLSKATPVYLESISGSNYAFSFYVNGTKYFLHDSDGNVDWPTSSNTMDVGTTNYGYYFRNEPYYVTRHRYMHAESGGNVSFGREYDNNVNNDKSRSWQFIPTDDIANYLAETVETNYVSGWERVTSVDMLKTNPENYFFAIFSANAVGLMVDASSNNTDNTRPYYKTAVNPLSSSQYLFEIENYESDGFALKSCGLNKYFGNNSDSWNFQNLTEKEANCKLTITMNNGAFEIQSANADWEGRRYWGLYDYTGYVDGQKFAGNKNDAEKGSFLIYRIAKEGLNMTSRITNPNFDSNIDGWTATGGFSNNQRNNNLGGDFNGYFWENWNGNAKVNKMYQDIPNMPNGFYKVKIAAYVNNLAENNNTQYVFANSDKTYLVTNTPKYYEVWTEVTNNTLSIGLEQTTATANWMAIDNVSLTYSNGLPESVTPITGKMNATVEAAQTSAINAYADNRTVANINTVMKTKAAAEVSKAAYANAASYLEKVESLLATTNFYSQDAYNSVYGTYKAAYDASTMEDATASGLNYKTPSYTPDEARYTDNTPNDLLIPGWTIGGNDATALNSLFYINTWSTESAGSGDAADFANPFYEYYVGSGSLAATVLSGTKTGLTPNTMYRVTANVRIQGTANSGKIKMQVGTGGEIDVTKGNQIGTTERYIKDYVAVGKTDAYGNLTLKFTVESESGISWLSFRDVMYAEQDDDFTYIIKEADCTSQEYWLGDGRTTTSGEHYSGDVDRVYFTFTSGTDRHQDVTFPVTGKYLLKTAVRCKVANTIATMSVGTASATTNFASSENCYVIGTDGSETTNVNSDGGDWVYNELYFDANAGDVKTITIQLTSKDNVGETDCGGMTLTYLGTEGTLVGMEVSAVAKAGTFVAPFDVVIPARTTAYTVKAAGNGYITLKEEAAAGATLAANTPVILYAEDGIASKISKQFYGTATGSANENGNGYLIGMYNAGGTIDADAQNYVMQYNSTAGKPEFRQVTTADFTTTAYRSYLKLNANNESRVVITFEGEDPTAINAIEAAEAEDGALKDGKYIIDNKVVIVKNGVKYGANGQKLN